jgi:hypothetical protein
VQEHLRKSVAGVCCAIQNFSKAKATGPRDAGQRCQNQRSVQSFGSKAVRHADAYIPALRSLLISTSESLTIRASYGAACRSRSRI